MFQLFANVAHCRPSRLAACVLLAVSLAQGNAADRGSDGAWSIRAWRTQVAVRELVIECDLAVKAGYSHNERFQLSKRVASFLGENALPDADRQAITLSLMELALIQLEWGAAAAYANSLLAMDNSPYAEDARLGLALALIHAARTRVSYGVDYVSWTAKFPHSQHIEEIRAREDKIPLLGDWQAMGAEWMAAGVEVIEGAPWQDPAKREFALLMKAFCEAVPFEGGIQEAAIDAAFGAWADFIERIDYSAWEYYHLYFLDGRRSLTLGAASAAMRQRIEPLAEELGHRMFAVRSAAIFARMELSKSTPLVGVQFYGKAADMLASSAGQFQSVKVINEFAGSRLIFDFRLVDGVTLSQEAIKELVSALAEVGTERYAVSSSYDSSSEQSTLRLWIYYSWGNGADNYRHLAMDESFEVNAVGDRVNEGIWMGNLEADLSPSQVNTVGDSAQVQIMRTKSRPTVPNTLIREVEFAHNGTGYLGRPLMKMTLSLLALRPPGDNTH